jgi:FtsH-binding integral membrane protein
MPLYPGGPRFGLGLWNSIAATMIVEIGMLAVGVWLYARVTRGRNGVGRYLFAAYVGLLLALYVANRFSPLPPSPEAVAWAGIALAAILIPWAWWFDRNRVSTTARLPAFRP